MFEVREPLELTSNSTELGPLLDPKLGRLLLLLLKLNPFPELELGRLLLLKLNPFPELELGRALLLKPKPLPEPELGRVFPPVEELGLELPPPPKLICLFSLFRTLSFSARQQLTSDTKNIDFIIITCLALTPPNNELSLN